MSDTEEILTLALDLAEDMGRTYRTAPDSLKRQLNLVFFDRVWLHIDDLDPATRQMITEIEDQPRNADSNETSGENKKPASSGGLSCWLSTSGPVSSKKPLVALGGPWTAKLQEAHDLWGRFQAGKAKKPKRKTPAAEYQPWPRLSEEQKGLICQEYLAGAPVKQIAAQVGCARQTVSQIVAQRGLKRSRSLKGDSLQAQMIELHEQGLTLAAIAAQLNCSADLVRRRLIKLGLREPLQSRGANS
ncbi:hypothetical protein HGQ17_01225 [Nesterenkonia sp. MY13]|uniref:Helix-turn-helix domain-containing protein n=1 Tax=Nesterenkonia sedimenti TaxID=1463632 RepID=A0A7X8TH84_9MICC|nr:helix-turn-helix domain-containing protein [Nesterenkonia sedimenti]NLS08646.1 hypothetical protein [Nesterenkonia sedimenti]